MRVVALDVGKQREIVSFAQTAEMLLETGCKRARACGEHLGIRLVREELDALISQDRRFCRQLPAVLISRREFSCLYFAGLDVGLIEGIDAEN